MGEANALASVALAPEQWGYACTSRACIYIEACRRVAAYWSLGEVMPKSIFDGVLFDDIINPESMGLDGD